MHRFDPDQMCIRDSYYSYPLQTEKRLIQCVLDGKEEALDIFDDVIRENIANKDLSRENLQNLIYAFIGTISRICLLYTSRCV